MFQSPAGFIPSSCLNRRQASLFLTRVHRIRVAYSVSLVRRIRVMCSVLRACRASMSYVLCCMFCVTRSSCTTSVIVVYIATSESELLQKSNFLVSNQKSFAEDLAPFHQFISILSTI